MSNPHSLQKYKHYRTQYNKIVSEAENSYFSELFNSKTNTKQLWNNLSSIASLSESKCKNNIAQLLLDGKYVSDTKVMSDSFNKYFCSMVKISRLNLIPMITMPLLHIYLHQLLRTVCFALL